MTVFGLMLGVVLAGAAGLLRRRRPRWYADWHRRRAMARGVRPAWVTQVRVRWADGEAEVAYTLGRRWWATEEDQRAAEARLVRNLCRHYTEKHGKPFRLSGPLRCLADVPPPL